MKLSKKLAMVCGVLLGALSMPVSAQQQGFYISDGRTLNFQPNGDPSQIKVRSWQYRLFKRGEAQDPSGKGRWGLIESRSLEEARKELETNQKEERQFERFFHQPEGSTIYTHFNALGPIAVIERPKTAAQKVISGVSQVQDVREIKNTVIDGISNDGVSNPYAGVGNVLKDYRDSLEMATEQVKRLPGILNKATEAPSERIDSAFNDLNGDLSKNDAAMKRSGRLVPSGAMIDPSTGLLWATKDSGVEMSQPDAEAYCQRLNLGGSGWRLPNIAEWRELISRDKRDTTLRGLFDRDKAFWSGTQNSAGVPLYVDFGQHSSGHAQAICVR